MKGYFKYYGKKIGWYLITLVVAIFLNFFLPRMMPGDPVKALAVKATEGVTDPSVQQQMIEQYAAEFGLDKPIMQQFVIYVGKLFQGDLGTSLARYPSTVAETISSSVLWTLALQIPALIVGWFLGNMLGAIAAYIRKGMDKFVLPFFMFFSNMPAFGLALVMVYVFALKLHIAPSGGGYDYDMIPTFSWEFIVSVLKHYQMPFWNMVLIAIGGQAIGMRSMSIYELNADYVKYSRFLGIRDRKIVFYVFRNAMLPQITGLALSFGTSIGGNLVMEMVYNYPGLGTTLFSSISTRDYPMLSGCTLMITIMVLIMNLIVEFLYGVIDPRVKATQMESD